MMSGPTIEIPTNWQAHRIAEYAEEQKEEADTQASKAHWSQLEHRIKKSLNSSEGAYE